MSMGQKVLPHHGDNDMRSLCVHMSELEALDSAGSLISIALQEICLTLV